MVPYKYPFDICEVAKILAMIMQLETRTYEVYM